jgi:O-antigen/teichoic acid export membrane protein
MSAAPAPGLRSLAVRGSAWVMASYAAGQLLRLGSNIILAHLLFPEAFALAGLVAVFLQGLEMFSDLGIGTAIVQNKRGDERAFLNTAWTMQVVRGVALWLVACAIAWPMSVLYYPQLIELLPVGALAVIFAGFNSTALYSAMRAMAFGRVAAVELGTQLTAIVVMIALAWVYPSVWALVIGGLTGAAAKMVLTHTVLVGPRPWLGWEPQAARDLWAFGRWIFISTAATFAALSADRLLLGKLTTADVLGVYMLAFALAMAPMQVSTRLIQSVMYSALSRVHRTDPVTLAAKFAAARRVLLWVAAVATGAVVLLAEPFFGLLYDARYAAAGGMAQLIAIAAWFTILQRSGDRLLQAMGCTFPLAAANMCNLLVTVPSALLGFALAGIEGFVLGYAAGAAAGYLVIAISLRRRGIRVLAADGRFMSLWAAGLMAAVWLEHQAVAHTGHAGAAMVGLVALLGPTVWATRQVAREVLRR